MKCSFALPRIVLFCSISLAALLVQAARADEPAKSAPEPAKQLTPQEASAKEADPGLDLAGAKEPEGYRRLLPTGKVWIDTKGKRVVMVGEVCLREGQLEMFACLKGTKEHEAIVAVPTKAMVVHAALLRMGADPGSPAKFLPDYVAASGPRVDVTLFWTDDKGKRHQCAAQDWITNTRTGKPMSDYWVFAGSGFYEDEETGQRYYKAEDGDFICISNFTTAMLDLPIESSQSNEALLFKANTAAIPPVGTKLSLVLTPRMDAKKAGVKPGEAEETEAKTQPKDAPKAVTEKKE
ncbi:MAG TPA: YdjY domain-containing protein [Pirellulales bacterium]